VQWNILNYGQITNNVRVQDANFQQLLLAYSAIGPLGPAGRGGQLAAFPARRTGQISGQERHVQPGGGRLAVLQYREGVTTSPPC